MMIIWIDILNDFYFNPEEEMVQKIAKKLSKHFIKMNQIFQNWIVEKVGLSHEYHGLGQNCLSAL